MTEPAVLITKASGAREPFSEAKLRRSLERVGAPPAIIDDIARRIGAGLKGEVNTHQIYQRAFSLLRARYSPSADRYSLKTAIMAMGPSGHPFEKLVGEVLKYLGYSVRVGVAVPGTCVTHEVDVMAEKEDCRIMVECKFHNEPGIRTDVKVALYVQARFEDVEKAWKALEGRTPRFHQAWLVTNTKLTEDAIQYAKCVGIKAIGWDYPAGQSLAELMEQANLQPLTAMTGLSRSQKQQLLDKGIILCRELDAGLLRGVGIAENRISEVLREAGELCLKRG